MRVLFVTKPHLPARGGAQLTVHWLALALRDRGHEPHVLCRAGDDHGEAPEPLGYAVRRVARPVADVLTAAVDEVRPDVVVVNGYHAPTVEPARAMLRSLRAPTVVYLHDYGALSLTPDADRAVAVSRFLADSAPAGTAVAVVPPIADPRVYGVATARRTALLVNPIPQKGVEVALRLAAARPDVPFACTLCWSRPPRDLPRVEAEARRLGNVEIRAAADRPADIYGDARVLLAPSVYPEAWGRVVREAQASGIPVLASARGGLIEAVGDGGLLIDPAGGDEAWAGAFARVWDDPAEYERLRAAARRMADRPESSPDGAAAAFEAVLAEATSVSAAPAA